MTRWLYIRRWSAVYSVAAYGLMRAVQDVWQLPLPEGVQDLVSFGLVFLFIWLLRATRVHEEKPPSTPLDT